jgi:hypothetical protein
MQIPPTASLLHALSRVNDPATSRPAAAARPPATAESPRPATTPEAARAAAKAAFDAFRAGQAAQANAVKAQPLVQPSQAASTAIAPAPQPTKVIPRGSFLNMLV